MPTTPKPPRARTSLELALAAATDAKTKFSAAEHKAEKFVASMRTDPEYLKGKKSYLDDLVELLRVARAAIHTDPFYNHFLMKEVADVRILYPSADTFSSNCSAFVDAIKKPSADLSQMVRELQHVGKARIVAAKAPLQKTKQQLGASASGKK